MIIPPENLEDIARKFGFGKYAKKKIVVPITEPEKFSITEDEDYYIINGVKIKDEWKTVKWLKQLLYNGISQTQHEWTEQTKYEEIKLPSLPTYIATIITLYDNKDIEDPSQKDLVEKIRKMFETDFDIKNPYLMTSTRIVYKSQDPDIVIHNYGYDSEYTIEVETTGASILINKISAYEKEIEAITGINDLDKIEKAIEWTTTKKPHLWVRGIKPPINIERGIGIIGISEDWFNINIDNLFTSIRSAHGVIIEDNYIKH